MLKLPTKSKNTSRQQQFSSWSDADEWTHSLPRSPQNPESTPDSIQCKRKENITNNIWYSSVEIGCWCRDEGRDVVVLVVISTRECIENENTNKAKILKKPSFSYTKAKMYLCVCGRGRAAGTGPRTWRMTKRGQPAIRTVYRLTEKRKQCDEYNKHMLLLSTQWSCRIHFCLLPRSREKIHLINENSRTTLIDYNYIIHWKNFEEYTYSLILFFLSCT